MNPLSGNKQLATNTILNGQMQVARTAGAGAGAKEVQKQEKTSAPVVAQSPARISKDGVETTTKPDGSASMKADSGVEVSLSSDGSRQVTLPGGEDSFKLEGGEVKVTSGQAKDVEIFKNNEGIELVGFTDKKGDSVQIDPESLTYEVVSKHGDGFTAQVMYPDGQQDILVAGSEVGPNGKVQPYEKLVRLDQQGKVVDSEGFSGLEFKNGKLAFDLGNGSTSRPLPRPIPGQVKQESPVVSAPAAQTSAPVALLAEEPALIGLPASQQSSPLLTPEKLAEAPATAAATFTPGPQDAEAAAKAQRKARMDELKKVGPDFFDPKVIPDGVNIQQTPSGVIKRVDEESVALSLPNGDKFRFDDDVVVALGDNPRAKGAKIVEDDGQIFLAYSDKTGNSFRVNIYSGDMQSSNSDGSLKQTLRADGSTEIWARSQHKSASLDHVTSEHRASFDPSGKLVEKSGFDDLQVDNKSLVYTLPNGKLTVRNLVDPTSVRHKEEKPVPIAPGVQEGWGDVQGDMDSILGIKSPSVEAPAAPAAKGDTEKPAATEKATATQSPFAAGPLKVVPSGMSRKTLEDGTVVTTLPNGLAFHDGPERFAMDPEGNRLDVLTREVPSQTGYILYTKSKDNVGYTITPDSLDMIAESPDGKVHQRVFENGTIDTDIRDGQNQHVFRMDKLTGRQIPSPGVFLNPGEPNRLYIDSPDQRSYELPLPLFSAPPGQGQGPGQTGQGGWHHGGSGPIPQPGTPPSLWEKTKAFFRGDSFSEPQYGPQYSGMPPHAPGMPSSYYQHDPYAAQMRQMERMNNTMMTMNMVGVGVSMVSNLLFMPTMFFGGGFF